MKVEREGGEYKPIVITLETEEEAKLMGHVFNCSFEKSLNDYCKDDPVDADELEAFTDKMWRAFDDVLYNDC